MLGIEYDERNAAKAIRFINQTASGSNKEELQTKFYTRLGAAVLAWIGSNFETSGGLVGGWTPLRPFTVFGRRMGSDRPLQNTGKLRQSFTAKVTANGLTVGSNLSIAKYQNFGTRPYDIYPRNAKALAFPAPPGGGGGGFIRTRPAGTPKTGMIGGNKQSFAVVKHVHHPGLPARRMIPTLREIQATIQAVARDVLREMRK